MSTGEEGRPNGWFEVADGVRSRRVIPLDESVRSYRLGDPDPHVRYVAEGEARVDPVGSVDRGPGDLRPDEGHSYGLGSGGEEVSLVRPWDRPVDGAQLPRGNGRWDTDSAGTRRRSPVGGQIRIHTPCARRGQGDLGLDHEPFELPVPGGIESVVGARASGRPDERGHTP